MDVPEEVMQNMADIQSSLEDVEEHLQPFLEAGPKEITAQLTPLERLKTHLALAQAAVVLYSLDRQLGAAKLTGHPIEKELERLSRYERKVQEAAAADDLARTKPGTSLNIAAANRFIDAAIPDLSQEQKAALRGKSNKQPGAGGGGAAAAAAGGGGSKRPGSAKGSGRGSNKGEQEQEQKRQRRSTPSAAAGAAAANPQAFIEELVAEVEAADQQQEQRGEGAQGAAAAGAGGGGHGGADVDAGAFLQDILTDLDGGGQQS